MIELNMRLWVLGDLVIEVNGRRCRFSQKKAKVLLIYLLLCQSKVGRAEVKELLWPSPQPAKRIDEGLLSLRNGLRDVGVDETTLKACIDTSDREWIDCRAVVFTCDESDFWQLTANLNATTVDELEELERAEALYQGDFLGGQRFKNVDEKFDDWLAAKDSALEECYHKLLLMLSIGYIVRQSYERAIHYLKILLDRDPEQLEAYGLLIICYSLTNNQQLVEATYRRYQDVSLDFDPPPDDLMQDLRTAIRRNVLKEGRIHSVFKDLIRENENKIPAAEDVFQALLMDIGRKPTESYVFQQVIDLAEHEAVNGGFRLMGTPHLFLALCTKAPPEFIDQLFTSLTKASTPVSLAQIVQTMRLVLGEYPKEDILPEEDIRHTLAVWNTRASACNWAEELGVKDICLSHLWLALLEMDDSLLAQILMHYGVNRIELLENGTNLIVKGTISC